METAVPHRDLTSSTPLSTIGSRRIDTRVSNSSSQDSVERAREQEIRQQENQILQQLRNRDREVRAHEAAHIATGRPHIVSGPSYIMQQGPDGRSYAIGGSVQLDVSEVAGDPDASLRKAEQVRRAALAPAEPSPQDFRVAANASQMAAQARLEIAVLRLEEQQGAAQQGAQQIESQADSGISPNDSPAIQAFNSSEPTESQFSQFV